MLIYNVQRLSKARKDLLSVGLFLVSRVGLKQARNGENK